MSNNPEDLTRYPVPSTAFIPAERNAADLDRFMNQSGDFESRNGVVRPTLSSVIANIGYLPPVAYADGIVFTVGDRVKTVLQDGQIYAPRPSLLPFTTPSVFDADQWFIVSGVTRSQTQPVTHNTRAEAVADNNSDRQFIRVGDFGGAEYRRAVDQTEYDTFPELGRLTDSQGNLFVLSIEGIVSVDKLGAVGGIVNDEPSFSAAASFNRPAFVPSGKSYQLDSSVTGVFYSDSDITTTGSGSITIINIVNPVQAEPVFSPGGPRSVIQYNSATSVNIRGNEFVMGGFRFHGSHTNSPAQKFTSTSRLNTVSTSSDLAFGMTSVVFENWYAVFAVANNGDDNCVFRAVPFLRVDTVVGSGVTLRKAGEAVHSASPQTYTWPTDGVNGADCLVITETISGRPMAFSGRETTITDSAPDAVTLQDIGGIAPGDWILPAPLGFDHYRYCGSFYVDTAEVRNIADSGTLVRSRGVFDVSGTNSGAVSAEAREPSGYISPLATAVIINTSGTLATSGMGQYVEEFGTDSAHIVTGIDMTKSVSTSVSFGHPDLFIPFSFGPQYYFSNAGGLATSRTNGQQNIYGWIEP